MRNNTTDIRHYSFCKSDHLLLDANIWLSIYGPVAMQNWRTQVYSAAWRDMRTHNSQILLDALVLSEFINAFARFEYNQQPPATKPKDFKLFRNSSNFKPIAEEITVNVKNIVRIATRCDSGFVSVDIDTLLATYEAGDSDFNDLMLAELCKAEDLIMVTHDADFPGTGINILTANKRLLDANNPPRE